MNINWGGGLKVTLQSASIVVIVGRSDELKC